MSLIRAACIVSLTVMVFRGASARDIFVDNMGGDDQNNGETHISQGRSNGPCRTINKALRLVRPGDRIILTPHPEEPYREMISVQGGFCSGYEGNPLEIIGNGAVLDGAVSLALSEWEYEGEDVFSIRPRLMAYQQLFLSGKAAERVAVKDAARPALAPLQWCLFEGNI